MNYVNEQIKYKATQLKNLAKQAQRIQDNKMSDEMLASIHLEMAEICNQIRIVEMLFKEMYPNLAEIYDCLIRLHDNQKNYQFIARNRDMFSAEQLIHN